MKKTILFRRLRNFVYAMMLPGMAMFIGSCSDEPNWERLPDRQRDDVQVRPEVKSDEGWEYSFSVNGLCGEGADSASVFMADWPDRVWVGNVFPEADFGAGFENNIPYPEMSLTLRTDFPQPYVGHCILFVGIGCDRRPFKDDPAFDDKVLILENNPELLLVRMTKDSLADRPITDEASATDFLVRTLAQVYTVYGTVPDRERLEQCLAIFRSARKAQQQLETLYLLADIHRRVWQCCSLPGLRCRRGGTDGRGTAMHRSDKASVNGNASRRQARR